MNVAYFLQDMYNTPILLCLVNLSMLLLRKSLTVCYQASVV